MGRYLELAKAVKVADFCGKVAFTPQSGQIGPKSEAEQVSPLDSTNFDSDRECEISELCEIMSGTDSCEKSEIMSAAGVATCPPGGHVVLLQAPDGVPAEWVQGVADLLAMPAHPDWPEPRWKTLQDDALAFLRARAAQAHALGWDAQNLFGVHAEAPRARLDGMGLVPLLDGRPVVALSEDSAAITGESGATLTYRRKKAWPPGCCLIWDLEGLL